MSDSELSYSHNIGKYRFNRLKKTMSREESKKYVKVVCFIPKLTPDVFTYFCLNVCYYINVL
jgi:hypothetical protein